MSINPLDPSLIHIRSKADGHELVGASSSPIGPVLYIHADNPLALTLPIGWVKVKTVVDGIFTEGFLNVDSNPVLSSPKISKEHLSDSGYVNSFAFNTAWANPKKQDLITFFTTSPLKALRKKYTEFKADFRNTAEEKKMVYELYKNAALTAVSKEGLDIQQVDLKVFTPDDQKIIINAALANKPDPSGQKTILITLFHQLSSYPDLLNQAITMTSTGFNSEIRNEALKEILVELESSYKFPESVANDHALCLAVATKKPDLLSKFSSDAQTNFNFITNWAPRNEALISTFTGLSLDDLKKKFKEFQKSKTVTDDDKAMIHILYKNELMLAFSKDDFDFSKDLSQPLSIFSPHDLNDLIQVALSAKPNHDDKKAILTFLFENHLRPLYKFEDHLDLLLNHLDPGLRTETLTAVLLNPENEGELAKYPRAIANDYDVCLRVVSKKPLALALFSDTLKANKDICRIALTGDPLAIIYASPAIHSDPEFLPLLSGANLLESLKTKFTSSRYIDPSRILTQETYLHQSISELCNFCGLPNVELFGVKMEGLERSIGYRELTKGLATPLEGLPEEDRIEFQSAFAEASTCEILNEATVEKIRNGTFVIIPSGFEKHSITIAFSGNQIAICNRGVGNKGKIVKIFEYDNSKISLEILSYLVLNTFTKFSDDSSGIQHQQKYLYEIFPTLLDAKELHPIRPSPEFTLSIKPQKMGNCVKASSVTAFKAGVYLKALERGMPERDAAKLAKKLGKSLSYKLRQTMISRAEDSLKAAQASGEIPTSTLEQASMLIEEAKSKLSRDRLITAL